MKTIWFKMVDGFIVNINSTYNLLAKRLWNKSKAERVSFDIYCRNLYEIVFPPGLLIQCWFLRSEIWRIAS